VATGEELVRLPGHATYASALAFSRDGATLACGSGDFTVRLGGDAAPLRTRYQACRAAAALRTQAERRFEQLWRGKNDPAAVAEGFRPDRALGEPLGRAALRAVLRRALLPESPPGSVRVALLDGR
jgi:hypothetical protein